MPRLALLLLAAALPLAACADDEVPAVDPVPDATPELPDPDPDTILDVDPLSRQDGQTSDDTFDENEVGQDIQDRPLDGLDEAAPPDSL
ncbi:hypothetical protein RQM47_01800 [Rubrivirga sp. S365]|uniref:Uncharacterized protein n=1 Tax=Rubrivirga litoralis TaxID=3075598 RepID=A0ABU3BPA9_9BACT|nr:MULTISPECIES: hypothetical protein [unclassified Rubrivirga]MDT0631119.1 hypothetical protein [Rubrivirga sp. F394]MDT7855368.1 hypothetical protein [Rubrivirga sp. S365]